MRYKLRFKMTTLRNASYTIPFEQSHGLFEVYKLHLLLGCFGLDQTFLNKLHSKDFNIDGVFDAIL